MKTIFWTILSIFICFNIKFFCNVIHLEEGRPFSMNAPWFFNFEILASDNSQLGKITSPFYSPVENGNLEERKPFSDLKPILNSSEIETNILIGNLRCNEFQELKICGENTGTTTIDGTMWLEVNSNIFNLKYIDTPDIIVGLNLYGWYFNDLVPNSLVDKQIRIGVPGPSVFSLGDHIRFQSYVTYSDRNGDQISSVFECSEIIECYCDSSNKLVSDFNPSNADYSYRGDSTNDFDECRGWIMYSIIANDTIPDGTEKFNTPKINFNSIAITKTIENKRMNLTGRKEN